MKKKLIVTVLITLILVLGCISLYSTFAYDPEAAQLGNSEADYDLVYSLKELSSSEIYVAAKDNKYMDITLNNTYASSVRYAMYYNLISPKNMPDNVHIGLAEESAGRLEDIIKSGESKVITIKITNDSDSDIKLVVGSVVGFENGNIEDLLKDNETLIK